MSDDLRVLRVGQGRGEAAVRCRRHDVEIGAPFVWGPISGQVPKSIGVEAVRN